MASKKNLKATDIEQLENTSMASALGAVDGAHAHAGVDCIGVSCVGVSCGGGTFCTGVGACCTGCTACSACTGCTAHASACIYKSNF